MLILKVQNVGFENHTQLKEKLLELDRLISEAEKDKIMIECRIRDLNFERSEIISKFKDWNIKDQKELDQKVELEKPIEIKPKEPIIVEKEGVL